MNTELLWAPVPGLPGIFAWSDGAIWNSNIQRYQNPTKLTRFGYERINIQGKLYLVHRLILCAFTDKPLNYPMEVDHIDRNRVNNFLSNLRWVDRVQNITGIKRSGQKHRDFIDVILSRYLHDVSDWSHIRISEILGIPRNTIKDWCNYRTRINS